MRRSAFVSPGTMIVSTTLEKCRQKMTYSLCLVFLSGGWWRTAMAPAIMGAAILSILSFGNVCADMVRVEGESYGAVGGPNKIRIVDRDTASGGKVVSYWEEPDVWLEWTFTVPEAGTYAISIRYACAHPETFRQVEIDGKIPTLSCQSFRFDSTGSWSEHGVATLVDEQGAALTLPFSADEHRIRMTNIDSVGLAVDVIYIHDPGRKFVDVALTHDRAAQVADRVCPAPGNLLDLRPDVLRLNTVRVAFPDGKMPWAWVTDTFLEGQTGKAVTDVHVGKTGSILAQLRQVEDDYELYVTDGQALYIATASPRPKLHNIPLIPRAYSKQDGTFLECVLWKTPGRVVCLGEGSIPEPATLWLTGNACITSTAPIRPAETALQVTTPVRVAAVKICPQKWSEAGLEIGITNTANSDVIRSSDKDFPALGEFYGYGRFSVEFFWNAGLEQCVIHNLANGERLELIKAR